MAHGRQMNNGEGTHGGGKQKNQKRREDKTKVLQVTRKGKKIKIENQHVAIGSLEESWK